MVVKHYHHHDKEAKYRKRLSFLYDSKWQRHRLVLLQYYYEEEEVQVKLKQQRTLCTNKTKHHSRTEGNCIIKEMATQGGLFRISSSKRGLNSVVPKVSYREMRNK